MLSVPLGVQGLISQEIPTRKQYNKDGSKENRRMTNKFNKKEVFWPSRDEFEPDFRLTLQVNILWTKHQGAHVISLRYVGRKITVR